METDGYQSILITEWEGKVMTMGTGLPLEPTTISMPNTYYSNSQWRVEAVGWDATWPRVFTRYMEVNMAYGGGHCIWRGASNSKISTERQLGRVDVGRGHPKKVLAPGHSQMGTPLPTAVSAL